MLVDVVGEDHGPLAGGQPLQGPAKGLDPPALVHGLPGGWLVGVRCVKGLGRGYLPPSSTQMVGRRISRQRKKPGGHRPALLETLTMLEALEENLLGQLLDDPGLALEAAVQEGEEGALEAGHEVGQGFLPARLQLGHPVFGGRLVLRWETAIGGEGDGRAHALGLPPGRLKEKPGWPSFSITSLS